MILTFAHGITENSRIVNQLGKVIKTDIINKTLGIIAITEVCQFNRGKYLLRKKANPVIVSNGVSKSRQKRP